MELYHRQVKRKGKEALIDGAYLLISLLQPFHPELIESIDFDDMELQADNIEYVIKLLDKSFKYGQEVELPVRCEDYFHRFSRQKNEPMQQYVLRHSAEHRKLKEAGIDIPDAPAGWHLFSRSAIPPWTEVQVKTMCFGDLQIDKVSEALLKIFGPDHVPNPKDLARVARPGPVTKNQEEGMYVDYYEEFVEDVYLEDDGYGYHWEYDEEYYDDHEEGYYGEEDERYHFYEGYDDYEADEEDAPEDLHRAYDKTEEAFMGYLDARKKMRELANSRGFYSVMAIGPDFHHDRPQHDRPRPQYDRPKGKGKGKGRGKGKGKGKGK